MASEDKNNEKPFGITNIKAFVPLTLDLDQLNYDAWCELFRTHCHGFGVLGHIDGSSRPTDDNDAIWHRLDSLVKLWIYGTISQSLLQMILKKHSSAYQVWTALESLFRDNKDARAIELENELRSLVLGDRNITAYCHQIKTISDLLANIDSPVPEKTLVTYLINGLSDKFEHIATIIRHRSPMPSFLQARSMLLLEEQRLTRTRPHPAQHDDHSSSPAALVTGSTSSGHQFRRTPPSTRGRGRGQHPRRNNGGPTNPFPNPQPRPNTPPYPWPMFWPTFNPWNFPRPAGQTSHRQQQSTHQGAGLLSSAPTSPSAMLATTQSTMQPPWTWFPSMDNNQATTLPEAFNAFSLNEPANTDWYMDTGATSHLASDAGKLDTILNKNIISSVFVGNGAPIKVTHTGHTTLTNPYRPLHLHNVLVTPQIIKNLISVRQFTKENKCSIEFDEFGFSVKDYQTRETLLRCDSSGDLYPAILPASSVALVSTRSSIWHQRLGHPSSHVFQSLVSSGSIHCNKGIPPVSCQACQLGKHTRLPFSISESVVNFPFEIVHSDLWTSPVLSISGIKYYIIFLDHFTHFLWVYPLRKKSDAFAKLLHFRAYIKNQFGRDIKYFQCDHGGEFDNSSVHNFFASNGIQFRFSCPRTSQQNGKSERMLRSINNIIRTLLFQAHMPPTFWVEALHVATHLLNILPSTSINNEIPFVRLFNKSPSYNHLRVFGCLCYPHLPSPHKLAPRSTPCVFLGYPINHRGYRCLDLSTRKIIISRHVVFNETIFPFGSMTPSSPPSYDFLDYSFDSTPISRSLRESPSAVTPIPTSTTQPNHPPPDPSNPEPPLPITSPPTTSTIPTPPLPPTNTSTHPMVTRAKSGITKPTQRLNLHTTIESPLPWSHIQAMSDPNWLRAMKTEYNALISNGTWLLVPRPTGRCGYSKKKYNADGSLDRYKARLVANGKSQRPGIDCFETFSPVVKPATIRTVLSLAVTRKWPIHQLDVKNAFLHGSLSETVYMHQPPGFHDSQHPDYVCHLRKSLYGLKQAPRAWFQRFATFITRLGFSHSRCDSSLFIYQRGDHTVYLLLYVDDIVLTASSDTLLHHIIKCLSAEFAMTDLGSLSYFLGISATRTDSGLFLSQQKYAAEIIARAQMSNCKPSRTPTDTQYKLDSSGPLVVDPVLYRSLAGALQYLTFTRPDITYAVQQVCLFMHDPREPHFTALKRIIRYLRGTMDLGLQLHVSKTSSLVAYSDADWGGCPVTRRSTSGYCVFLGDNLVSWSSKRQATISRSSAEAEYRGVANAVAETCWLRNLLRELHSSPSKATIVYCDNVSAVYLSSNPVQHQRTKHIEIDIHFVRDKEAMGHLRVIHVPSSSQYADIFTKGLPFTLFSDFRDSLSVRSLATPPTAGAY
ncbi:hypothetical protein OSB04_023284 [Centaurea solstitialis]|uniref:Integrase catalytic domain-containing protein n=1 Tax=Centaurea solstitialis TaxID=347529 RepID=A0AA38VZH1_9ASTR|nr:hypothetical protein OSB04_023284 [Centaurea solstitialis]